MLEKSDKLGMDNPEKQTTLDTQDTGRKQIKHNTEN